MRFNLSANINAATELKKGWGGCEGPLWSLTPFSFLPAARAGPAAVALGDGRREAFRGLNVSMKADRLFPLIQGPAKCSFCLRLLSRGRGRADCQGPHLGPGT